MFVLVGCDCHLFWGAAMFVWCLENPQRALGCGQQVAAILESVGIRR